MSKRTRILAAVMATMVMTTAFIGCKGKEDTAKDSGEKKSITVWSHLSTAEVDKVREVATKWGTENNCDVKVVEDKGEMQAAITALQSSKGPDVYFGLAHDNLGTYQKAGVLAEVPSGTINEADYSSKGAIEAITIGGKQYAVPLSTECVALFYNKALVETPAASMEDVVKGGKFMYDAANFYMSFGFLSANGGYVFKNNNGALDTKDIGLGNEGAQKGYQFIQDLVVKDKLFAADITDDIAKSKFKEGATDYYITGPWAISDLAGINLGITPLPTLAGKQMKPFMGVQAAFVSSKSANKDLSWKLVKYLEENTGDIIIEKGNRIPALKKNQESDKLKANKYADVFIKAAEVAIPMPNVPEVQQMWTPGANNLKALIAGSQDAKTTADKIEQQMTDGIAQQK